MTIQKGQSQPSQKTNQQDQNQQRQKPMQPGMGKPAVNNQNSVNLVKGQDAIKKASELSSDKFHE